MPGKDLAQFDVKLLRLFDVLYGARSVTRAAQQLGQSQPTLSIWLNKLRQQFNDPLFVRTSHGMEPTLQADALVEPIRAVLDSLEKLAEADTKFDPRTSDRKFRICTSDSSHVALLPDILDYAREHAPNIRIEALRFGDEAGQMLRSGEADIALIGSFSGLGAGFYQQTLFTQGWVCLTRRGHPRLNRKINLTSYRAEKHIEIRGGGAQEVLQTALRKAKIERNIAVSLPGILGLSGLLQNTDLVATVPHHIGDILAGIAGLSVLPCPFPVPAVVLKQHWHARYHQDSGNRWLRSVCDTLFRRSSPYGT